jgi:hypothetical protein
MMCFGVLHLLVLLLLLSEKEVSRKFIVNGV